MNYSPMTYWLDRVRRAAAWLAIVGGAGLILMGALAPWAQMVVFKNIDLNLPGIAFSTGGLCLGVAALVLLGARRLPLLCLAGAVAVLFWTVQARNDVPRRVKHQVIGAQMAFFPLNRLLDQFHIGDVEVASFNTPDDQLLGPGVAWTSAGGGLLLLGSLLGLPSDPSVIWLSAHTRRSRCKTCGASWLRARDAAFCPDCGTSTERPRRRCPACLAEPKRDDYYCINCGSALPDS